MSGTENFCLYKLKVNCITWHTVIVVYNKRIKRNNSDEHKKVCKRYTRTPKSSSILTDVLPD